MQRKATRRISTSKATPPTIAPIRAPKERGPYFCDELDFEDVSSLLLLVDDDEAVMVGAVVAVVVWVGTKNKADVPWAIAGALEPKAGFNLYISSAPGVFIVSPHT